MVRNFKFVLPLVVLLAASCDLQVAQKPLAAHKVDEIVAQWSENASNAAETKGDKLSPSALLKEKLEAEKSKMAAPKAPQKNDPVKIPNYTELLDAIYQKRDFKLGLASKEGLTKAGKAALEALQNSVKEGYPEGTFKTAEIEADVKKLEALSQGETPSLEPTDADIAWAKEIVSKVSEGEENPEALIEELNEGYLERRQADIDKIKSDMTEAGRQRNQLRVSIELALAKAILDYAFQERHQYFRDIFIHPRHDDYFNDPEIKKARPDKAKAAYWAGRAWRKAAEVAQAAQNKNAIVAERLTSFYNELLKSEDPEKVVKGLMPQTPQYQKMIAELERYQKIVDQGGWNELSGMPEMGKGAKGPKVAALKARLLAEGYDVDTSNNTFDDKTVKAIEAYQQTHQFDVNGKLKKSMLPSLNVSAESRRDQIILNLKRWRASQVRHEVDSTYVFVNIPDFMLDLWSEGERKMRFAVVVGNNDMEFDEEERKKIYKNRTPVPLAAYIDRVIYNPFWNVTARIREDEILPEVAKEVRKEYEGLKEKLAVTISELGGEEGAAADPKVIALRKKIEEFPYLNKETGEIDVSKTDKNHVPGWYARNNYEVVWMGPNWEYVRMTQGPHNALGQVKVIFPNYYDVYLHDTPQKSKFKLPIRAFSHGCIRMAEPLDFAEFLLRRDKLYESEGVPKILASGQYQPIFLKRRVPVFLEYMTVRVDDEGRANFLADPYRFDSSGVVIPTPPTNKHLEP